MSEPTIQQTYDQAVDHHRAGRREQAEALCRQILQSEPRHGHALHLHGVIAHQAGRNEQAAALIAQAIAVLPESASFYSNLGVVLVAQGKLDEAVAAYGWAIALRPDLPDAHNNLGNTLRERGDLDAAIEHFRTALSLRPGFAEAHNNLAGALAAKREFDAAVDACREAIRLRPALSEAYHNLGGALQGLGRWEEAIEAYRAALALRPDYVEVYNNLGHALRERGSLDESIQAYRKALSLRPDSAEVHNNLANVLRDTAQLDEALAEYRRSLELRVDPGVVSNLLYAFHFHPEYDSKRLSDEHARWAGIYEPKELPQIEGERKGLCSACDDAGVAGRTRLRVGYVSPYFAEHPIGRFMLPLMSRHDHEAFEIFCYSDNPKADAITEQIRACAEVWRSTIGLSDDQLAAMIRNDRIDILVDLTMHIKGNRLGAFARKAAPIQVTYLAYCGTTGLRTMGYRLTDPYLDPPGSDESCYSEQSVRLPHSYWCYSVPAGAPEVGPPPHLRTGLVTFGCLNNYAKVSPGALKTWCEVLRQVPQSQLVLHSRPGSHRDRAATQLASEGIDPRRLRFVGMMPLRQYFEHYLQIDIALDPFPYPGGTTTCDALWMGVPVVSLAGATAVSRGGLSILSNVGLPQLVAHTPQQYVHIAVELANDTARLVELRATLRERMKSSKLMDAGRFAHDVQEAYRTMYARMNRSKSCQAEIR